MAGQTLGDLDSKELNPLRETSPGFDVDGPRLGPAWLSTISLVAVHRVDGRSPFEVSLEKRFESWRRGTDECDVYFDSDEDPEYVSFPYMWVSQVSLLRRNVWRVE